MSKGRGTGGTLHSRPGSDDDSLPENPSAERQNLDEFVSTVAGNQFLETLKELSVSQIKSQVAALATAILLIVFGLQIMVFSCGYVYFILHSYGNDTDGLGRERADVLLDGAQFFVPVTSTLLGVAIGYYFRDQLERLEHHD